MRRLQVCCIHLILGLTVTVGVPAHAQAETCSEARFAAAVDAAGAALRKFNADTQPALRAKLDRLGEKRGWDKGQREARGLDLLFDKRIEQLDAEASELLTNIDALGRPEAARSGDCGRLRDLETAGKNLLAVMEAKSSYLGAKIDRELGTGKKTEKSAPPTGARTTGPAGDWEVSTALEADPTGPPSGEAALMPPEAIVGDEAGYSIEEIREASRGFFGTISTSLASVIEHAFAKSGRPTAYILGTEGGGAFLAGLRYGKGTLYLRSGGSQPIYWHGPSIGSDIGAEGSRTLYLVYRLKEPGDLFRRFAGIDGTAYLVGGVGITFLKGGDVIMAPIRSGLGLRLGASVGYLRFTPTPTWNPF